MLDQTEAPKRRRETENSDTPPHAHPISCFQRLTPVAFAISIRLMKSTGKIELNNKKYDYRELNSKFGCVTIASQELNDALFDDDCCFVNDHAEKIDELIFFYVPSDIFSCSEKLINKYLERNLL
jgi:hypothetical protein